MLAYCCDGVGGGAFGWCGISMRVDDVVPSRERLGAGELRVFFSLCQVNHMAVGGCGGKDCGGGVNISKAS